MGSPSKEENILELFFNMPTKHWHFEAVLKQSGVSRSKANKWLSRFVKDGIIKRIKPHKAMPYYVGNFEGVAYQNRKRVYALEKFYEAGFLNHLASLPKARAVFIFGSFSRWDWHVGSDIDLFVYGDYSGFDQKKYSRKLHREIQLFNASTVEDFKKFGEGLMRNIVSGYLVKGDMSFIEVTPHV